MPRSAVIGFAMKMRKRSIPIHGDGLPPANLAETGAEA
jgi:hypothetical protein